MLAYIAILHFSNNFKIIWYPHPFFQDKKGSFLLP